MRIQKCQTWLDWRAVGEALEFGRRQVEAEIEKAGRGNRDHLFSAWLKEHGFDKIDKATRSHLAACMAHQEEIEQVRQNIGTQWGPPGRGIAADMARGRDRPGWLPE